MSVGGIQCLSFFTFFYISSVVHGTVKITADYTDHELIDNVLFFWPGQNLTLTCLSDNSQVSVEWTYSKNSTVSESTQAKGSSGDGFKRMFHPLTVNDGGLYRCNDGSSVESFFVNILDSRSLIAADVTTEGTKDHVILRCNQSFERPFPLIWTFSGMPGIILNDIPNSEHTYHVKPEDGWTLVITNQGFRRFPLKTGHYTCQLNLTTSRTGRPIQRQLSYEAEPDVGFESSEKSTTATKGETFSITCIYSGHDDERIKWTVTNDTNENRTIFDFADSRKPCTTAGDEQFLCGNDPRFMLSRNYKLENASEQQEKTSVLMIKNIQSYDRGVYQCHSKNKYGVNSEKLLVRVKDKLAALWPFLGILAEIFVLIFIICICERKRSKQAEAEASAEQVQLIRDSDGAATDEQNLRNRK